MSDDAVPMEASVQSPPATISQEERMYAAACHFAGLPIFITVALANLIAPLVIWLIKKDTMPFVDEHGKESLNFQITLMISYAAAFVVSAPLMCIYIGFWIFGVLACALAIVQIVLPLIAGIAAYEGRPYRYPMTIRMIR